MGSMEIFHWVSGNVYNLVEAVGIIASLLFTAASSRRENHSRQISNLLTLTAEHRDIWMALYKRPELARVLDARADLAKNPVTNEEALFITFLLLHLSATFRGMKAGMFVTRQALEKDIGWFLSLPIPNGVWQKSKAFLESDFVAYVELCLKGESLSKTPGI
jgi:hypothetical protein